MTELKPIGDGATDTSIVLTIIITCYNTSKLVQDCLGSIYRNPPSHPFEIIVVDDASIDDTSRMVRDNFPEVRLLRNEVNRHYARSNNRGLDHSRGEFVMLLNSDTIVLPGSLDGMVDFLQANPHAGAVGCKLLNEDGSVQWSVKSLPNPAAVLFGARSFITKLFPNNPMSRQQLLHLGRDMTKPFIVQEGYVSGAASMMPRKLMQQVGYLDPNFVYHIDADYCKRTADAGYPMYYLPTAAIIHLNHRGGLMASPLVRFRSLVMFEVQSYRYYRKHFQSSNWSPMRILVAAGLSFHFLALCAGQVWSEIVSAARGLAQPKRSAS